MRLRLCVNVSPEIRHPQFIETLFIFGSYRRYDFSSIKVLVIYLLFNTVPVVI